MDRPAGYPQSLELETLQMNWRKVSSTHNLQDLLDNADEKGRVVGPLWLRRLCGALMLLLSGVVAIFATWVLAIHFMPLSVSSPVTRAIQQDWYYCCLIPLTLPVLATLAGVRWFSLKLFKHNS